MTVTSRELVSSPHGWVYGVSFWHPANTCMVVAREVLLIVNAIQVCSCVGHVGKEFS